MTPQQRNDVHDAALAYIRMGWNIIPLRPNLKPYFKWKRYQDERITEEMFKRWWQQYPDCAGIAVITGKQSGIVGFDIDAKHGRNISEFNIQPTAIARTKTKGWHVLYQYPDYDVRTNDTLFGVGAGLKARGGLLVLAPSRGVGGVYKWETSPSDIEIDEMPDWLSEKIKNGSNVGKPVDLTEIVKGVPDGNRNDAACTIIGTLLHRFPKSEWGSAWALTDAWNKSNKPPIPDTELRTKFNALAEKEAAKSPSVSPESGKKFREAMSLKELCELDIPPVDWDIERLIEHGTPNMLSAAPNNFKSWVILHEALCMAKGAPLFGHFKTKQQAVMIVNEDDHKGQLKNRLLMLLRKESYDLPLHLHIQDEVKLNQINVDNLLAEAKHKGVTCIIFDTLRAVHNADENDSSQMQIVMDFFMHFIREGITVIFTHHHRKKPRENFGKRDLSGEESRGSTSINAAVHGHLMCEPKMIEGKEKLVIYQPKLKCDQKLAPFQVDITFDANQETAKFTYEGDYNADDTVKGQIKDSIAVLLKNGGAWLSKKDLSTAIKAGSMTTIRQALRELESEKRVIGKVRSELAKFGVSVSNSGAHNEKFYQVPDNDVF
jgi:hypothetical protein